MVIGIRCGRSERVIVRGAVRSGLRSLPMVTSLVLLPSPLLGPSVWKPVVHALATNGWTTMPCSAPTSPHTGREVLDSFLAQLPTDQGLILVAHSNAGAYIPILSTQRSVAGAVFVDALLPPPRGDLPLAPPAFLNFLRQKVDAGGVLPVWTDWWEESDVAALFPDNETRHRIEREQPRLPMSYFEDQLVIPDGWDEGLPAAYLAFGNTYSRERDDAERRQWPVTTLVGDHLHLVNDPIQVATALIDLLKQMGITAPLF